MRVSSRQGKYVPVAPLASDLVRYIPSASRGNRYLSFGNRISISYLEQQDKKDLVNRHLCNARRDWPHEGDESLRVYHDRS